ncbi:MAG: FGLLP motif-containing membrane protein [Chloroflexota bacterium]
MLALTALLAGPAVPVAAQAPAAGGYPVCLPEPADATAARRTVTDSAGETHGVAERSVGADRAGVAVDAAGTWGRVVVAGRGTDTVTLLYGRSDDLAVACRIALPGAPSGVALDPATGFALVTLAEAPRVVLVDARTAPGAIVGVFDLPGPASAVVLDADARRAYLALPDAGLVAVVEAAPDGRTWTLTGTAPAGAWPRYLDIDPIRGRLIVSAQGQPPTATDDQGKGEIRLFALDGAGVPVAAGTPIPASVPAGVRVDPATGSAVVLENGTDAIVSLVFPDAAANAVPTVTRAFLPGTEAGQDRNPVDLVLLPATRELAVTLSATDTDAASGAIELLRLDADGRATYDRSLPAPQRTRGIALDPVTGRVFVTAIADGTVLGYGVDAPSAPPPPPASIAESMPSPLQVSLAPEDVARTVGLSLLVLLLVGAPTPLFNETLESHVDEIRGWFRRLLRRPRRAGAAGAGGTGDGGGAAADAAPAAPGLVARIAAHPAGIVAYTAVGALIFSFLTPGFPFSDGLLVFGVAFVGLGLAMAADIVPGDRYVRRRYGRHGTVRVALWTLAVAAACVLVSRLADLSPGFMYGLIGAFAFPLALTVADEGRMEARGALALLGLALGAWFLRIPFQPPPGMPAEGPAAVLNAGLVGIFIVAVENLVFGLIPLRFMPGRRIFAWSKLAWALLWGAGLALFAHVLVYPVTTAQPNPDPAQLQVTLVSVAIYGALAVGLWAWFRWRPARAAETAADVGPPAGSGG